MSYANNRPLGDNQVKLLEELARVGRYPSMSSLVSAIGENVSRPDYWVHGKLRVPAHVAWVGMDHMSGTRAVASLQKRGLVELGPSIPYEPAAPRERWDWEGDAPPPTQHFRPRWVEITTAGLLALQREAATPRAPVRKLNESSAEPRGPAQNCGCGFWSHATPALFLSGKGKVMGLGLDRSPDLVLGAVLTWGQTIEHVQGRRSQFAQVIALYGPTTFERYYAWEEAGYTTTSRLQQLREVSLRYDVPLLETMGEFTKFAEHVAATSVNDQEATK